jgi:hypothetical protein
MRNAKITHFHHSGGSQQQIPTFDIAMNNALRIRLKNYCGKKIIVVITNKCENKVKKYITNKVKK